MRIVNAEFKNPQAGIWDTLNSACPSGAAVDAVNVEFPEAGGVRKRGGFEKFSGPAAGRNIPAAVPFWTKDGQIYLPNDDYTNFRPQAPWGTSKVPGYLVGSVFPYKDRYRALHPRSFTVRVQEPPYRDVGFLEVEASAPGTTYTIQYTNHAGQEFTTTLTLPDNNDPRYPKLNLENIPLYIGAGKLDRVVTAIPADAWEQDPEFPELMTTRSLFQQTEIRNLHETSPKGGGPDPHKRGPTEYTRAMQHAKTGQQLKSYEIAGLDNNFPGGETWPAWRPVVAKDGDIWKFAHEFDYEYLKRELNPNYNAEVQKANNKYQEDMAKWQITLANETSRTRVAALLGQKILADSGGTVLTDLKGIVLRVGGITKITATDSASGTHLRANLKDFNSISDLPPSAAPGDTARVAGVRFEFTDGIWKEAPSALVTIPDTAWSTDYEEAGWPGFVDSLKKSKGTLEYFRRFEGTHYPLTGGLLGSRTVVVTTRGILVSAVGDPDDFWPSSAVSPRPDDGYYINIAEGADEIRAALIQETGVVVVTRTQAFVIRLGAASEVVITKVNMGEVRDNRVLLARSAIGTLVILQDVQTRTQVLRIVPSPEGGRYTTEPVFQQWSKEKPRESLYRATADVRGTRVFVHGAAEGWMLYCGESPAVTRFTGDFSKWAGFIQDDLYVYRRLSDGWWIMRMRTDGSPTDETVEASITFHPPPQWRSYAPDGRYTLKQAACWQQEGSTEISCRSLKRTFKEGYPAALPIHQPGEWEVTFKSKSDRWWVKAFQYTLVTRNGKTPGGWN